MAEPVSFRERLNEHRLHLTTLALRVERREFEVKWRYRSPLGMVEEFVLRAAIAKAGRTQEDVARLLQMSGEMIRSAIARLRSNNRDPYFQQLLKDGDPEGRLEATEFGKHIHEGFAQRKPETDFLVFQRSVPQILPGIERYIGWQMVEDHSSGWRTSRLSSEANALTPGSLENRIRDELRREEGADLTSILHVKELDRTQEDVKGGVSLGLAAQSSRLVARITSDPVLEGAVTAYLQEGGKDEELKKAVGAPGKLPEWGQPAREWISFPRIRSEFLSLLGEAKKSIIVLSPWIEPGGVDQPLLHLLHGNVKVLVGYGYNPDPNRSEQDDTQKEKHRQAMRALNNLSNVRCVWVGRLHSKRVLVDARTLLLGSYNFLSFNRSDRKEDCLRIDAGEEMADRILGEAMIDLWDTFLGKRDEHGDPVTKEYLEGLFTSLS